jgi:hypothetical protein
VCGRTSRQRRNKLESRGFARAVADMGPKALHHPSSILLRGMLAAVWRWRYAESQARAPKFARVAFFSLLLFSDHVVTVRKHFFSECVGYTTRVSEYFCCCRDTLNVCIARLEHQPRGTALPKTCFCNKVTLLFFLSLQPAIYLAASVLYRVRSVGFLFFALAAPSLFGPAPARQHNNLKIKFLNRFVGVGTPTDCYVTAGTALGVRDARKLRLLPRLRTSTQAVAAACGWPAPTNSSCQGARA